MHVIVLSEFFHWKNFLPLENATRAPETRSLCSDVRPWWCHQHPRRRRRWRVGLPKPGSQVAMVPWSIVSWSHGESSGLIRLGALLEG